LFDRIDRAKRIGNVRDGNELRFFAEQFHELFQNQFAAIINRNDAQRRTDLFGEQLPWHDVRMMLQFTDDDFIARTDVFASVTLRDEIDGLGRATKKNNFLRVCCAEKLADFSRLASNNSVERVDNVCAARWMLELSRL